MIQIDQNFLSMIFLPEQSLYVSGYINRYAVVYVLMCLGLVHYLSVKFQGF
jgi:hypothetical protein